MCKVFRNERNIRDTGPQSINNTGDGNKININLGGKILNRTLLYDFCLKFSAIDDDVSYELVVASDIQDKMEYNQIPAYQKIFREVDYYFNDVDYILEQIPKRERILAFINRKYDRLKRTEQWSSKDKLCDLVYDSLFELVASDRNSSEIFWEDVDQAIHALMYYAFVKCKLLDPVPAPNEQVTDDVD